MWCCHPLITSDAYSCGWRFGQKYSEKDARMVCSALVLHFTVHLAVEFMVFFHN